MGVVYDKHIDQWNRTKSPEINPHIYIQLLFNKSAKTNKESTVFSWNGVETTEY